MSDIFFHEDDYCQLEILPMENLEFCLKQAGLIDKFAETHSNGIGYTDMFVRRENPISMHERKISSVLVKNMLIEVIPQFDEVYTGYSSCSERCDYIKAFGCNENVVLFFDEKDGFVKNIWFTLDISTQDDLTIAKNILITLSKLGEFIIADWGWSFIESIMNFEKIEQYLQERLKTFAKDEE